MKRGDIITVSVSGDYGKPRPAVVVQSDWLYETDSTLVILFSSDLRNAPFYRLLVEPESSNNLKVPSQIMVDKIVPVPRHKCGKVMGKLDEQSIITLNHMISLILGLAD